MRTKNTRWYSSLSGAASVLDFSGNPRWFHQLAPPPRPGGDAEAIAGDFRAIGGDLERALLAYAKRLPAERRGELARRLAADESE
ncbi:MAG TPA: hypothetical protein VF632_26600 [Longimicrobium sp.]|jgi:hypothetical protein